MNLLIMCQTLFLKSLTTFSCINVRKELWPCVIGWAHRLVESGAHWWMVQLQVALFRLRLHLTYIFDIYLCNKFPSKLIMYSLLNICIINEKMRKNCLCYRNKCQLFGFIVNQIYIVFNFMGSLRLVYFKSKIFTVIQFSNFTKAVIFSFLYLFMCSLK